MKSYLYEYQYDVVVERPFIIKEQHSFSTYVTWTSWCSQCKKWEPLDSHLVERRRLRPMSKLEFLVLTGHRL